MRRSFRDVSIATRLSLVALLVTLVSLTIAAGVGLQRGSHLADNSAEDRLVTVAATRASSVEAYLRSVRRSVAALGVSPGTASAIDELAAGYDELAGRPPSIAAAAAVQEYYLDELVPELERVRGTAVNAARLVPRVPAAIMLQSLYTVPPEPTDDGTDGDSVDRALIADAGDGSAYSAAHAQIHPIYSEIAARSGFDDLFLIDARRGTIVYSVRKRTDFGTSLAVGPLSGSSLSSLVDDVAAAPDTDAASVTDFAAYPPTIDAPRMFLASQVRDADGAVVGYVAASVSTQPIDDIMSGSGAWDSFGETGDTYVVGADGTLRTTSRALAETPAEFLAEPEEPGPGDLTDDQRRRIRLTGTTALIVSVEPSVLDAAALGDEVVRTVDASGTEVVSAARVISVPELGWTVVSAVDADELDGPITDYARNMLMAVALFVVAVTFAAVRWSDRVVAPIRAIASRLRAVRQPDAVTGTGAVDDIAADSPREYLALSSSIDQMLDRLDERRAAAAERAAERDALVAGFLPPAVAQRARLGDDVLDHVDTASVAVVSLDGVGRLVAERREPEVRQRLGEVVDQLDDLAADFGLDRVKVTGANYYAVCGVSRPYLDHAPRTVGFALAAAEAIADVIASTGVLVEVRCGVDSGPVSVGLAGRSGLVYDAWGTAVAGASDLSRLAPSGAVAVSPRVRDHLSSEFVVDDGADGGPSVVTGRVSEVTT